MVSHMFMNLCACSPGNAWPRMMELLSIVSFLRTWRIHVAHRTLKTGLKISKGSDSWFLLVIHYVLFIAVPVSLRASTAGAETTTGVIMTFILAMLTCQDVQHRAQSEIDSVVGYQRLPTFSDINGLPYFSAMIKEVLRCVFFSYWINMFNVLDCVRWNPIGPLGVPHATTDEDVYEGYCIPKDCLVISNI